MLVRCIDTKQYIEKEDGWCAPNRRYYSSEEAYYQYKRKIYNAKYYKIKKREKRMAEKSKREVKRKLKEEEKIQYDKCVDKMFDWMEYSTGNVMPPVFFKRVKEWHTKNNVSYEIILETMNLIDDQVRFVARTKEFKNDFTKVLYICAIIANNLNEGIKSFARKQRDIQEAHEKEYERKFPSDEELENIGHREHHEERSAAYQSLMNDIFGSGA